MKEALPRAAPGAAKNPVPPARGLVRASGKRYISANSSSHTIRVGEWARKDPLFFIT